MTKVLFFSIHNTTPFWTHLARSLDFAEGKVFSDLRGEGDHVLVDDFYVALRGDAAAAAQAAFSEDELEDIVRRCRTLRCLDRGLATRMIGAMHTAVSRLFDREAPELVVTFTMDRYVMDVIDRIARWRGADFVEMTTSIFAKEVLFLRRGRLIPLRAPQDEEVADKTDAILDSTFAPAYVQGTRRYGLAQFYKTVARFELRGAVFNLLRHLKRDPLNLHYLDARKNLDHKVRWSDVRVLRLLDEAWQRKLQATARENRVFLGLQLFPEASMDYWLRDPAMLDHDRAILRYCDVLGESGFQVFVKDHPLQFGFRQRELMEELHRRPFVTLMPYEVPANPMIAECPVSVTLTGTIGFQAAVAGNCSVVTEPYYADEAHYLHVRRFDEIDGVAERIRAWSPPADRRAAAQSMVRHLSKGSVPGDYFMFRRFDAGDSRKRDAIAPLVDSLNAYLPKILDAGGGARPAARRAEGAEGGASAGRESAPGGGTDEEHIE